MTQAQGNIDKVLLIAVMLLLAIGMVMVYSSSSVVALTTYNDPTHFMRRQIAWAALGLLAMVAAMRLDHTMLADKRVVAGLLLVSFALLAAAFFPGIGRTVNGARRGVKAGPVGRHLYMISHRLLEEHLDAALRGLAASSTADSETRFQGALTGVQTSQRAIRDGLNDLLRLLEDWNDFQDVVRMTRRLKDAQRDVSERVRQGTGTGDDKKGTGK